MPYNGDKTFRQRLQKIIEDQASESPILPNKLKEKGVESALLLPLLEDILGFDPVDDIEYEVTSKDVYKQRFDFLIDKRFVVESKALNTNLDKKCINQIKEYIAKNSIINYGILTNGFQFVFLIQKSFIEKIANDGEEIKGARQSVYNVLNIQADDDFFYDIITLFSKPTYDETFKAIAKFAFRQLVIKRGPTSAIASDRNLDEYIKNLIDEKMDFKQGYYLSDIRSGNMQSGDKLKYEDKYIKIIVEVQPDGTIKLPKGNIEIKDFNGIMKSGEFLNLMDYIKEWYEQEQVFEDPRELFRAATGKLKISKGYAFKPI